MVQGSVSVSEADDRTAFIHESSNNNFWLNSVSIENKDKQCLGHNGPYLDLEEEEATIFSLNIF